MLPCQVLTRATCAIECARVCVCVLRLLFLSCPSDDEVDEIVSLRFDGGEDDTDDEEMDLSGAGAVVAHNSSLLREALDEDDFRAIVKDG